MSGSAVRAGRAFVEVFLKDQVSAGLRGMTARMQSMSRVMAGLGASLMATTAGIGLPLAFSIKTFADFDDQMRQTKAVSGATGAEFDALTAKAKALGASTSFTAVQVGSLMAELGRAGFSPAQIETMTAAVLDLARATSTDATLASGIMAASIRQFGLGAGDATRVADGLTAAANKSFNTVEQLGEALSYAGPVAADFGMSIEDTLAILGGLGNVGIQASNAGTALRRLLTLTGAEAKRMQGIFGVGFVDSAGNARPLIDTLGEVNDATAGLGTAARAAKFNEAFGLLGITGASAIGKGVGDIRALADAIKSGSGIAADAAKQMDAGLGGSLRILLSAIEGVQIALGTALAPVLQQVGEWAIATSNSFNQFITANKALAVIAVGSVAGIGLVGVGLTGLAVAAWLASTPLTILATVTSVAGTVLGATSSLIGTLTSGLIVKRVAALAAAGAMRIYSASAAVARVGLVGLAGSIGIVRGGVAAMRLVFVGAAGAIHLTTAAAGLARAGFIAVAASTTVLGVARSIWGGITAAVLTARGAMTLANAQQLLFTATVSTFGAVDAVWRGITAAVLTARGAITLANVQQLAYAAGTSVLGVARSIWGGITAAVLTARGAMTLANVQQLAFAAGTGVLGVARSIWAGITAAVLTARSAMTLANVQQLAMGAGTAVLAIARGVWAGLSAVVFSTGTAMALVRGISLTTAGAMAVMTLVANGGAGAMALLSGALAAVQAAALGPLAPIALVAAAVVGLGAVLYVNRESIFDFLGNSLAGLGPILDGISTQWSAFAGGISSWFSGVIGEARIAWDGISAAIAVNDLQSAWTIAWNTMKLVALSTFGPLTLAWNEFTTGLTSMFDGAIVGIRTAWHSAATFISQTMFSVLGAIQSTLDRIAEFDPTGAAAKLRGLLDVDTAGINQMLGEDNDRFAGGLERDKQARDEQRGTALAEQQAELAAMMAEAEAEIRQARDDAAAAAKAKQAEALAEPVAPEASDTPGLDQFLADLETNKQLLADAMAGVKGTEESTAAGAASPNISGTFSSAAAIMLQQSGGSGSAEERTARATEAALEKSEAIAKSTAAMERELAFLGTVG